MSRAAAIAGFLARHGYAGRACGAVGAGRQLPALPAADRRQAAGGADGRAAARGCRPVPADRRASGGDRAVGAGHHRRGRGCAAWCWRRTLATISIRCCWGRGGVLLPLPLWEGGGGRGWGTRLRRVSGTNSSLQPPPSRGGGGASAHPDRSRFSTPPSTSSWRCIAPHRRPTCRLGRARHAPDRARHAARLVVARHVRRPGPRRPRAATSPPPSPSCSRPVAAGPRGFVHRDFFAGNLLWLPRARRPAPRRRARLPGCLDRPPGLRPGLPAAGRAPRSSPPPIAARAVARYLARPARSSTPPAFRAAYAACAAQRHLRVAGQWVRLARRDNRPAYLAYGPHTWALLNDALRHPAAAPLAPPWTAGYRPQPAPTRRISPHEHHAHAPPCCSPPGSARACARSPSTPPSRCCRSAAGR